MFVPALKIPDVSPIPHPKRNNSEEFISIHKDEEPDHKSDLITSNPQPIITCKSPITQVAKVNYRDLLIGIYIDSTEETSPRRFFYEPIVLLDTRSIGSQSHGLFKKDFVSFYVQMWNPELRSKVLERVRSLPDAFGGVGIQEDDIYVMPYEEVELVFKADSFLPSIKLMDQPTTYLRSRENLDFYLLCDTPSTSNVLVEDFRRNPSFTLNTWQLALECRGLALGNGTEPAGMTSLNERPTFTFYVTVPTDDGPHRDASQNNKSFE